MHAKTKTIFLYFISLTVIIACLSTTATESPITPPSPTSIPPGQVETNVAATIFANETSTSAAAISPYDVARTQAAMTQIARPTSSSQKYMVNVPANACWMNSNVDVLTGQTVTISASGIWNTNGGNEGSNSGPDGQKYICGAIQCPVQGVGYGALIGQLEDLKPFFVGRQTEFVATKDGQLHFTVNDWECDDNSGSFNLVITVE